MAHGAPRDLTIAQMPLGTANDLASAAGISLVGGGSDGMKGSQEREGRGGIPGEGEGDGRRREKGLIGLG